jgi:hypothetical protein
MQMEVHGAWSEEPHDHRLLKASRRSALTHAVYREIIKARAQTSPTLAERARLHPSSPGMPSEKQTWCIHCDSRSGWWNRRSEACTATHPDKAMPDSPNAAPSNAPRGERATLGHLLTCHRSQSRIKMARDSFLAQINRAIQKKADKEGTAQTPWDLASMEWLNPDGLDPDTVTKLSRPRTPNERGLSVKRGDNGGVRCEWLSERQAEACPPKQRLQTANRLASWAGIPPSDLRPALLTRI